MFEGYDVRGATMFEGYEVRMCPSAAEAVAAATKQDQLVWFLYGRLHESLFCMNQCQQTVRFAKEEFF